MVEATSLHEFCGTFGTAPVDIVVRSSFEGRSSVLARGLAGSCGVGKSLVFTSRRRSPLAEANLREVRSAVRTAQVVELDRSDALATADAMRSNLGSFFAGLSRSQIIVDVSTFPREELLVLLRLLCDLGPKARTTSLAYVGAKQMGDRLSGEVVQHRSVLGYAGDIHPSRKTKLVLLLGLELARARSIIDNYEPSKVVLGLPRLNDDTSGELRDRLIRFRRELAASRPFGEPDFEFSVRDPVKTCREIVGAVGDAAGWNVVLAPLNTKLSTLGAGLYGLTHDWVQVCYAAVADYQERDYSQPNDKVFKVAMSSLLDAYPTEPGQASS